MKFLMAFLMLSPLWFQPGHTASQAGNEQRFMALTKQLRCLVCQNQSIAESNSSLALDLRREIRVLTESGQSDEEIKKFLVQRYGDIILYQTPFKPLTWVLWLGPLFLLVFAIFVLVYFHRNLNP